MQVISRMMMVLACCVAATALLLWPVLSRGEDAQKPPNIAGVTSFDLVRPPSQGRPWEVPANAAPIGPLVAATEDLFRAGMADPRGCEYREVTIETSGVWNRLPSQVIVHSWVMPKPDTVDARPEPAKGQWPVAWAVGWNGLVYPVEAVGPRADLVADVTAMIDGDEKLRVRAVRDGQEFRRYDRADPESQSASHAGLLPLKACMLLRLGEVELATKLWSAWRAGEGENRRADAEDPFMMLATHWIWAEFDRAITAHMRSADRLALTSARSCVEATARVRVAAHAHGFKPPEYKHEPIYLDFTSELDPLIPDTVRRMKRDERIDKNTRRREADAIHDPSARAEALVELLDEVQEVQHSQPGGVGLGNAPIVQDLVGLGDAAVEPLLECLENDRRLTRSVSFHRDFFRSREIIGVHQAAYVALLGILEEGAAMDRYVSPRDEEGRKQIAAHLRAYWEKIKDVPLAERWYLALANEKGTPQQWVEAAEIIVRPGDVTVSHGTGSGTTTVTPSREPEKVPPMRGDGLRTHAGASVGDLMARRAKDALAARKPEATVALLKALAKWEGKAGLTRIRDIARRLRDSSAPDGEGQQGRERHAKDVITLAELRHDLGDPEALSDYASFVREVAPGDSDFDLTRGHLFRLMWRNPENQAIAASAAWLFSDPESPWLQVGKTDEGPGWHILHELWETPLVAVPAFQSWLLRLLDDTSDRGEITYRVDRSFDIKVHHGWQGGYEGEIDPDENTFEPRDSFTFRTCDLVACELAKFDGFPRCELYWPEDRRNRAVAACKEFMRRYGPRLAYDPSNERDSWGDDATQMTFPARTKPATRADVNRGEAIFSMEGEPGTVTFVPLAFPVPARWAANERHPFSRRHWRDNEWVFSRGYHQDGRVWQAEDHTTGGNTTRYYGFVGRFECARVSADELEFPAGKRERWSEISNGLDVRLSEPGIVRRKGVIEITRLGPESPLVVSVELRNRKAVPRDVPGEVVRSDPSRLARGITVHLSRAKHGGLRRNPRNPDDKTELTALAPLHDRAFVAADTRNLEAAEVWEAGTFDLHDFFDIADGGQYAFWLTFSDESGFGEGVTKPEYFSLAEQQGDKQGNKD